MLPEALAANTLPAASTAAASMALGSTQSRTRLKDNTTEVAAGMRVDNLATTTLLSGLLAHDTAPDVLVEVNGVAGSQAKVAPEKVITRDDCGGRAALGVNVTVMALPDTTTVGWLEPRSPTIAAIVPAALEATTLPPRSMMEVARVVTVDCATVGVDTALI